MAQIPYSEGVAQVDPTASPPGDYLNINANANQFGGSIGQGLQAVGQGVEKQANFYDQAATDDAFNNAVDRINKRMNGDPSVIVKGPDGQDMPDLGFMGLKGRAAMDERPLVEEDISKIINETKGSLSSQEQVQKFESAMRRYRVSSMEKVDTHTLRQADSWYVDVNKSTASLSLSNIASNADDPVAFHDWVSELQKAYKQQVTLEGGGSLQYEDAEMRALRDGTKARIDAIAVNDPARAQRMVEKNKGVLGVSYEPMAMQVKARADRAIGVQTGKDLWNESQSSMPYTSPGNPLLETAHQSNPGSMSPKAMATTILLESNGDPNIASKASHGKYVGLVQIGENEFKQYGPPGGDRRNPQDAIYALGRMSAANGKYLNNTLGRPPTDAEQYLAWQQGAEGARKLIMNPDARVGTLLGNDKVFQNGGNPDGTARQFANMWIKKFNSRNDWEGPAEERNQVQSRVHLASLTGGPIPQSDKPTSTLESTGVPTLGQKDVVGAPTISKPVESEAIQSKRPSASMINDSLEYARSMSVQNILQRQDAGLLNDQQANAALEEVHQRYSSQKVLQDSTKKLKQELEDKSANDLYSKIYNPAQSGNVIKDIDNDPYLDWKTKEQLKHIAVNANEQGTAASPEYMNIMQKVTNGQITEVKDLLQMQIDGKLTKRDVSSLSSTMASVRSDPLEKELQKMKSDALKQLETKIVYDGETGPRRNNFFSPKGEEFYRTSIVNRFENEFKNYRSTEEGKRNPYKFFETKNLETYAQNTPSSSSLSISSVLSPKVDRNALFQENIQITKQPMPAKPEGMTDYAWTRLMTSERPTIGGKLIDNNTWSNIVTKLIKDPSETTLKKFNDAFKGSKITAENIIEKSKRKEPDLSEGYIPYDGVF